MSIWSMLGDLPVTIDSYRLERLEQPVSSGFVRVSTVVRLDGDGEVGLGEDVTYDAEDHDALQRAGAVLDLSGSRVLAEFADRLDGLDLFPRRPVRETSRFYRRWAFESAALDLALRQKGRSLAEQLGRPVVPPRFVVSMRLGDPPSVEPVRRLLDLHPEANLKLDPTSDWDDGLVAELAATGRVRALDLKGHYEGTVVDSPPDPELYRRVAEGFPEAWIEDPALTPGTEPALRPHRDRITWDAPLHSVADIQGLPFEPRAINVKPSRFGTLESLCAVYDFCAERGIGTYGGGQFELGPGRGQIQLLAALFHPEAPNDVAPAGYNRTGLPAGLPDSPLDLAPATTGFRAEARDHRPSPLRGAGRRG